MHVHSTESFLQGPTEETCVRLRQGFAAQAGLECPATSERTYLSLLSSWAHRSMPLCCLPKGEVGTSNINFTVNLILNP